MGGSNENLQKTPVNRSCNDFSSSPEDYPWQVAPQQSLLPFIFKFKCKAILVLNTKRTFVAGLTTTSVKLF
jgi:hypothetical protein